MNSEQYSRIFTYLHKNTLPTDLTNNSQINRFKNFCRPFIVKNNYLYRKDRRKEENNLRVIRRFEMKPVLYMMHNDPTGGHFATNYVRTCDSCQRRERNKKLHELHSIPVHSPFHQIGIDFVGPLPL